RAVLGGPTDAVGDVRGRAPTVGVQDLHGHEARVEGDAGGADAVVRRLRDRAGDVRAVALIVVRVLVRGDEVPAGDALGVGEIAALVVRTVRLARDAGVDDGDRHTAARREVPRARRADALHVPLLFHERVVRREERVHAGERLGRLDTRIVRELRE